MYINPSYVHKLAAQLDAPITSYFDGVHIARTVDAPSLSNIVIDEELKNTIESMKGLHDMWEPWIEGSSYKSDKVGFLFVLIFDFFADLSLDSMRSWSSCIA